MPTLRNQARINATNRKPRRTESKPARVTDCYGENLFDFRKAASIPKSVREELITVSQSGRLLRKEHAEIVAQAVTKWAISKGVSHFCHWFQPLTGAAAQKHDAFLDFDEEGRPIEKLSSSQLMTGEPDASSFPNGGTRSTFEARGYTTWDMSSPMFISEGTNGKLLCIPTAFVSYTGEALDIKTPLLRSISKLGEVATHFMNITGSIKTKTVTVTCGAEQEYFLIDKAFYHLRPDLVMTGRTLFGSLTKKNQQLNDHYFGVVQERVLAFMQELDHELYRLGIPAKTRHNEVAPGQFEIAPIFTDANLAADHNQLIMALIKEIAIKHDMVALLHEKPFAGINGSGKHLNWSMSDNNGVNLLSPGDDPHQYQRFLAMVSVMTEVVARHGDALRLSIASHGNDHRLGGHEAPPSIISVYLGNALSKIFKKIEGGEKLDDEKAELLDLGVDQLAVLLKDNTDRNRTSPFAFTGNRFEFRAAGSSVSIGFPLSILNAAVVEVLAETNEFIENELESGKNLDEVLISVVAKWYKSSKDVIFDGDGYSASWVQEASKRRLPNLKTTFDALKTLTDSKATSFLRDSGIMKENELESRYHVMVERYNMHLDIEFSTFIQMIDQYIIPSALCYKERLARLIEFDDGGVEKSILSKVNGLMSSVYSNANKMRELLSGLKLDEEKTAFLMASDLLPLSSLMAEGCNQLEEIVPDELWELPKYYDMLFAR